MMKHGALLLILTLALLCAVCVCACADTGVYIAAEKGNGLPGDVYPITQGTTMTFYLPAGADMARLNIITPEGTVPYERQAALTTGGVRYALTVARSTLPCVYLTIDERFGTTYDMLTSPKHTALAYGDMTVTVNDDRAKQNGWQTVTRSKETNPDIPGTMQMRGRGNSTWEPKETVKNSFQIKLEKKADLLGMGKAKSWILLRNTYFMSSYMDWMAFTLASEAGLPYTSQSEFVDVYLNGSYYGLYLLCEKIQVGETRVDIVDLDDQIEALGSADALPDITGGYLLELDNFIDARQFRVIGNLVTLHSPEELDASVSADSRYRYIINKISDLFNAVYTDGYLEDGTHFINAIDAEAFARFYWIEELLINEDIGTGSTYLYKDSDAVDARVHIGPIWDTNRAFSAEKAEEWVVRDINGYFGEKTLFHALLSHQLFARTAVDVYTDAGFHAVLTSALEKTEAVFAAIAEADRMDALRWPTTRWRSNQAHFTSILEKRLRFLDAHYRELLDMAYKNEPLTRTPRATLTLTENDAHTDFEQSGLTASWTDFSQSVSQGEREVLKLAGAFGNHFILRMTLDHVAMTRNNQRVLSVPGALEVFTSEAYDAASQKTTHNRLRIQSLSADGKAGQQTVLYDGSAAALDALTLTLSVNGEKARLFGTLQSADGTVVELPAQSVEIAGDAGISAIYLLNREAQDRGLSARVVSCTVEVFD